MGMFDKKQEGGWHILSNKSAVFATRGLGEKLMKFPPSKQKKLLSSLWMCISDGWLAIIFVKK